MDSRLGAQLNANFTSQLSGVLQVVAEQRHDATYRPRVEWANLKYEFTPDLSIRAGRIVLPILMVSDSRKVGYAQPWVRPPVELYSLIPLTSSDGIDLSYRMHLGEVNNTLQIGIGGTSADTPDGGEAISKDGWLISDTVEYGDASFHFAYSRSKLTVEPFKVLFDGFREYSANAAQLAQTAAAMLPPGHPLATRAAAEASRANAVAEKYDPDSKRLSIISVGGSYDPGDWFIMAEWAQTDNKSVYGKRQGWYATGGYRFGAFTPYLSYAEAKLKSRQNDPGIAALPVGTPFDAAVVPLNMGAAALSAELNEQLSGAAKQKTISLGVRWDFARSAALKLQYDRSHIGSGSTGTLDHALPDFRPGGKFEVFSATVDFVFKGARNHVFLKTNSNLHGRHRPEPCCANLPGRSRARGFGEKQCKQPERQPGDGYLPWQDKPIPQRRTGDTARSGRRLAYP